MIFTKEITNPFHLGLTKLGFQGDDLLFLVNDEERQLPDPFLKFHLETAKDLGATAVYFRSQLNRTYEPQVYLFDFTDRIEGEDDDTIADIQTNVWSSGEVPLASFFFRTEIKIVDCTKHITTRFKPEYLISNLNLVGKAHDLYNEHFAVKIKTGLFWEEQDLKKKFKFQNSAYDTLIQNIRKVSEKLTNDHQSSIGLINKILVQAILIKYLEERIDTNGNMLLSEKYFKKYDGAHTFNDVLSKGRFVDLLGDLNRDFNGNVFTWSSSEKSELETLDLNILAKFLSTNRKDISSQQGEFAFDLRYFEFKYIPVELISRLYEEFLGEDKHLKGLYYTPSHLAKMLIDECLPLSKYKEIKLKEYKVLDPACGSGIFLVVAFKRLVQIWRLQNNMDYPTIKDLKHLLRNIYGVDKESQAIRLASFSLSLALCNELNPIKIINELRFDDLSESNLIWSDFFECKSLDENKFDLIVGNPPFVRGAITNYTNVWQLKSGKAVKIPQGQIALKFLSESFKYLKSGGLSCLIIKSSGLLYNATSNDYKKELFSNYNVVQIFDFTALARNKSLWDNGADVASAAIFVRNEQPTATKNILHLTFRRTIATKERIFFEIDDYDFHFVTRQAAIQNEFIWKINLLGGGRIKAIVDKAQMLPKFRDVLKERNCTISEGFIYGNKVKHRPDYIYKLKTLPNEAISELGIDYSVLNDMEMDKTFAYAPSEETFTAPNVIIWEKLGKNRLPVFFNEITFTFKHRLIGISHDNKDKGILKNLAQNLISFSKFYQFYFLATSPETLINRNNTFLLRDIKNARYIEDNRILSDQDNNVIQDCLDFQQSFFINGERSKATASIRGEEAIKSIVSHYGEEFSKSLNSIYQERGKRKFRLSDIVELDNSMIATVFKFDNSDAATNYYRDLSQLKISKLSNHQIYNNLSVRRILKLYPEKDMIIFIKPNQYRYWLSLTAYRDADKCFSDFSISGY